ncbi:LacI family DNA-binding transcriptional regulator [Roseibium litorale]|uniref:LacI family DNA-binding transcriptional regulator n=1 Tax=Roseibium litorale TaxID=2803841 RepID=A0ABR9CNW6_9HYPH|nr:LacI family DNA-binding transcriptional regulator [Roseibium litorale]MBD8892551.1 LacI family DNA-binding transcriptional regulator [Roseibium litorale]
MVAEAAGVSKMTASRVLRNEGGFSPQTRDRVLAEVERLGYLPNRIAAVFSGDQKSTFIGVSIPDLGNEVFTHVLEGIDRKLSAFGHQTVLGMTQRVAGEEEKWIGTVLSWQPAGLILTGVSHAPRVQQMLEAADLPVVEIWELSATPFDMCVGLDHEASGRAMGRYLVSKGYKHFGYVGTHHDAANAAAARLSGFGEAVKAGEGRLKKQLLLNDVPGFYTGYYGVEQLLSSAPETEVVFFQNDNMAMGAIQFCQAKGISVPGDLGIAGWGELPIASVLPYRLTTVRVNHLRIGQAAAEKLLLRISGDSVDPVTDVGFQLIEGETV